MTRPLRLTGAQVLTPSGLQERALELDGGLIVDTCAGRDIDLSGVWVMPGLVDVHGDAFDIHLAPRRGAMISLDLGLMATEAELASNGITTGVLAQFYSWEGGMRGPEFAENVFAALEQVDLTVIGNVADDEAFHGLWVSPDIDTLTYSLAGLINREQGWGVADEGLRALDVLKTLGQDTWMTLGDRDLGLHIYRTMRRAAGDRPSQIAQDIAVQFGVTAQIVLPTDDTIQTRVQTDAGWISFQEYFVREKCVPDVRALQFDGIEAARPTPEALTAIKNANLIVIAPSNPLVSIAPILKRRSNGTSLDPQPTLWRAICFMARTGFSWLNALFPNPLLAKELFQYMRACHQDPRTRDCGN